MFLKTNCYLHENRNQPILKIYFDVDFKNNLKRTNYFINRLKKTAEQTEISQGKMLFAIANKNTYKDEWEKGGFTNEEFGIMIDDKPRNLRYKFTNSEFNG